MLAQTYVKGKDAMRFLDRFRATKNSKEVVERAAPAGEVPRGKAPNDVVDARNKPRTAIAAFDTWVDPHVAAPEAEWERRLNAYARKSAGVLRDAGVPLFRSK